MHVAVACARPPPVTPVIVIWPRCAFEPLATATVESPQPAPRAKSAATAAVPIEP